MSFQEWYWCLVDSVCGSINNNVIKTSSMTEGAGDGSLSLFNNFTFYSVVIKLHVTSKEYLMLRKEEGVRFLNIF